MNTEALQTFVLLAKEKNFSATAKLLFISQSTVTKRIAELEKELNTKLFIRDHKHVFLTTEGQMFLHYASRIMELTSASLKELHSSIQYNNHLRIGATNALYECHLLDKIEAFNLIPDHSVKVTIDHSSDLITWLLDGILDVAFTFLPLQKTGYECFPYQKDNLVLVTHSNNIEFAQGIHQAELSQIHYLMCNFALQEAGVFIRELFPLHHQFKFEIDNSTKLIPYLLKGNGYSFIPQKMIEEYLSKKALRIIPLLDFETPSIHSYCIGNKSTKKLWSQII